MSYKPLLNPSETISVAWPGEKSLPHDEIKDLGWACQIAQCPAEASPKGGQKHGATKSTGGRAPPCGRRGGSKFP